MSASAPSSLQAYRGTIVDFVADPEQESLPQEAIRCFEDGILLVKDGKVWKVGESRDLLRYCQQGELIDYTGCYIMPGFVDTHIHYPQTEMIASYGASLLEWLEQYTYPTEVKFADYHYARKIAQIFIAELLKNGTTSALVFASKHKESVKALFEEAEAVNMRLIAGKVLMDCNAPPELLDSPEICYQESKELIKKWHHKGRLLYAVTPRFALCCSPQTLKMAHKLKEEFPDIYVHTHLSENRDEVSQVAQMYPERKSYLDVYEHFGLVSERSVFAHCIYLQEEELQSMARKKAAMAHCPTSNLFLGSGLFNMQQALQRRIKVGLGTDVGGGTSFSLLHTMHEAYKVAALQGMKLSPFKAFYLATLGGAKALQLDQHIGNFLTGKEADFIVLNPQVSALQKLRMNHAASLADRLFSLMMLGDERNVKATYVYGQLGYESDQ